MGKSSNVGKYAIRVLGVPLTVLEQIFSASELGDSEIHLSPYPYPYLPHNDNRKQDNNEKHRNPYDLPETHNNHDVNSKYECECEDEYEWFDAGHCNGGEYRPIQK